MSSPFNNQHCRSRRMSPLCHAPWHVRTHSPFHPSLSPLTKLAWAPHHIPRHRPRTGIRRAEKFVLAMCVRLCAIGRDRGAHWMPETTDALVPAVPGAMCCLLRSWSACVLCHFWGAGCIYHYYRCYKTPSSLPESGRNAWWNTSEVNIRGVFNPSGTDSLRSRYKTVFCLMTR
jgi:hypothetical protein